MLPKECIRLGSCDHPKVAANQNRLKILKNTCNVSKYLNMTFALIDTSYNFHPP